MQYYKRLASFLIKHDILTYRLLLQKNNKSAFNFEYITYFRYLIKF